MRKRHLTTNLECLDFGSHITRWFPCEVFISHSGTKAKFAWGNLKIIFNPLSFVASDFFCVGVFGPSRSVRGMSYIFFKKQLLAIDHTKE